MNINFRAQPEPLLSPRGSIMPGANEEKMTYFPSRHNPHSRTVCHMKGLNDVPVCIVRDQGYISGHSMMTGTEQGQSPMRTRTSVGHTFPGTTMPTLQSHTSKRNSFPQPGSNDMKEDIALLSNRTRKAPILNRKNDLLRKYIPEQSQNMPVPDVRAFSPTLALRYRPKIMEDMNYTLTYLDHEIKILEKLRDILQTDSLSEIKEWVSKASLNEKEFVSNFIRSNITARDLLNYYQKYGQNENEAAHLNLQAMLKGSKATGSTGEEKQLRNVSQGSRASIGTRSDRERDNFLTRREKLIIPVCDALPLVPSPSRSKIQEKRPTPSEMPQTSTHLLYSRYRTRHPQGTSGKKRSI